MRGIRRLSLMDFILFSLPISTFFIKRVQYLVGIKEEGQRLIMECGRRLKIDHGMWEEGQRLIMEKPFTYSENMTLTQVP